MKTKFKIGDRVVAVKREPEHEVGNKGRVDWVSEDGSNRYVAVMWDNDHSCWDLTTPDQLRKLRKIPLKVGDRVTIKCGDSAYHSFKGLRALVQYIEGPWFILCGWNGERILGRWAREELVRLKPKVCKNLYCECGDKCAQGKAKLPVLNAAQLCDVANKQQARIAELESEVAKQSEEIIALRKRLRATTQEARAYERKVQYFFSYIKPPVLKL